MVDREVSSGCDFQGDTLSVAVGCHYASGGSPHLFTPSDPQRGQLLKRIVQGTTVWR